MRLLSLIIAAGYIALFLITSQPPSLKAAAGMVLLLGASLIFPLACIWFADEMGEYVDTLPGSRINKRSPGGLVKAGGWVLLLLPFFVWWFVLRA